jgi:hypothetical protein
MLAVLPAYCVCQSADLCGCLPSCHLPSALQCYGFLTFDTPADAEGVLDFAQQQGVQADDCMLRINWAQGSIPDWKVRGTEAAAAGAMHTCSARATCLLNSFSRPPCTPPAFRTPADS